MVHMPLSVDPVKQSVLDGPFPPMFVDSLAKVLTFEQAQDT